MSANDLSGLRTKLAMAAAAFLFTFAGTISLLMDTWSYPDFTHGALIPVISLYMIWTEKDRLKNMPLRPALGAGAALVIAGGIVLVFGNISSTMIIQQVSILVMIPGLVLLLLGPGFLRAAAFPLAYLILMVPVLDPLINRLHMPFQLFTAKFAAWCLPYLGVPVFKNAQFLNLPNVVLEVAEECSGAKFMISVIAISIPIVYFARWTRLRKALFFIYSLFVAMFTNALRVTLIGVWSYYELGDALHGPYHLLQGYFVFIFGLFFLFTSAYLLNKIPSRAAQDDGRQKTATQGSPDIRSFNRAWGFALIFLLAAGFYMYLFKPVPVPLAKDLKTASLSAPGWRGVEAVPHEEPLRVAGTDSEVFRAYTGPSGRTINLYAGYFERQTHAKKMIQGRLSRLYRDSEAVEIPAGAGRSIAVNRTKLDYKGESYIVLYWYDLNGRVERGNLAAKLISFAQGVVSRHTNGAVIMVFSRVESPERQRQAVSEMAEFVKDIFPALEESVKNEHSALLNVSAPVASRPPVKHGGAA